MLCDFPLILKHSRALSAGRLGAHVWELVQGLLAGLNEGLGPRQVPLHQLVLRDVHAQEQQGLLRAAQLRLHDLRDHLRCEDTSVPGKCPPLDALLIETVKAHVKSIRERCQHAVDGIVVVPTHLQLMWG